MNRSSWLQVLAGVIMCLFIGFAIEGLQHRVDPHEPAAHLTVMPENEDVVWLVSEPVWRYRVVNTTDKCALYREDPGPAPGAIAIATAKTKAPLRVLMDALIWAQQKGWNKVLLNDGEGRVPRNQAVDTEVFVDRDPTNVIGGPGPVQTASHLDALRLAAILNAYWQVNPNG